MNEIKMKRPWRFFCFVSPGSSGSHRTLQRLTNPTSQAFPQVPTKIVGREESWRPRWRVGTTNHPEPFRSCLLICRLVKHPHHSSQLYQPACPSELGNPLVARALTRIGLHANLTQRTCRERGVPRLTIRLFSLFSLFSPSPHHDPTGKNSLLQVLSLVVLICGAGPRLRERVHIFTWFVQLKKPRVYPLRQVGQTAGEAEVEAGTRRV